MCSNSLRSDELTNAVGLLKEEMRRLGSLIMESADKNRVAAGGALAVDREGFSRYITERLRACPNIEVEEREAHRDTRRVRSVIATGPLTSDAMADAIVKLCPEFDLHFYDAVAPIVTLESVDMESAYLASRYEQGHGGLCKLPHDEGGVRGLRDRAEQRRRRPPCTALTTARCSKAACPSRSWPAAGWTRCATGR